MSTHTSSLYTCNAPTLAQPTYLHTTYTPTYPTPYAPTYTPTLHTYSYKPTQNFTLPAYQPYKRPNTLLTYPTPTYLP